MLVVRQMSNLSSIPAWPPIHCTPSHLPWVLYVYIVSTNITTFVNRHYIFQSLINVAEAQSHPIPLQVDICELELLNVDGQKFCMWLLFPKISKL